MRILLSFCLAILLAPLPIQANGPQRRYRALVPIYMEQPIAGAFGSLWTSEFAVHNSANAPFYIDWCSPADGGACILNLFHDEELRSDETQTRLPQRYPKPQGGIPGAVVYFHDTGADVDFKEIELQLRVADTSRRALSAGTEIPVVREQNFRTSKTNLLNVPIDLRFRLVLRLYEMNLQTADFAVRVYDQAAGTLLSDRRVTIASTTPQGSLRFVPTYGEITDLEQIALLQSPSIPSRLRVSIEPLTAGSAFWGFVSVTNNETQEFTVVTPQ